MNLGIHRVSRGHLTRLQILVGFFSVLLPLPSDLAAQDAIPNLEADEGVRILGSVVNRATGEPIASAAIALAQFGFERAPLWSGVSDTDGRFRTDLLPLGAYALTVEILPFSPLAHVLAFPDEGVVDLDVEMVRVDFELEPIVVYARRLTKLERMGFYERQAGATGHFLTGEDIEERAPMRVSDLFRTIPGARVIQGAAGRGDGIRLRGGCTPVVVLDGIVMANPVRIDELFPVMSVEGIEVYHGSGAPIQYTGMTTCGVIILWSRDPTTTEGRALSWARVLTAVGFGVLVVIGAR